MSPLDISASTSKVIFATQATQTLADATRRKGIGDAANPGGRKTWSVIETALPRLFELRSFSLVGIALVPPKG